jgi:cell division protein FtsL
MSLRAFVIAVLVAAILASGVAVVYARQQHRQAYVELNRLLRQRDEINLEFSRLQLEQATWSETNRIEQVASQRLGMVSPQGTDVVVLQP